MKARTSAMISLKAVLVNAPPELREQLEPLTEDGADPPLRRTATRHGHRPDAAATKHTLRAIARRWRASTPRSRPTSAADRADRRAGPRPGRRVRDRAGHRRRDAHRRRRQPRPGPLRSGLAKLCGVAPIPASSGMTTRHRLNRGGHRQANAALYRAVIVRMQHHQPTQAYVARAPPKARPKPRSSAASSACSPARSGPTCDPSAKPGSPRQRRLTAIGASTPWPRRPSGCSRPSDQPAQLDQPARRRTGDLRLDRRLVQRREDHRWIGHAQSRRIRSSVLR